MNAQLLQSPLRVDLTHPFWTLGVALPWLALLAGLLTAGGDGDTIEAWHLATFVVVLLLLGIPHGAVDHIVMAKMTGRRLTDAGSIGMIAAYASLAAAVLAVWWLQPGLTFLFFLAMTLIHWGEGDLWFLRQTQAHHYLRDPVASTLAMSLRGLIPLLVTWLAAPDTFTEVTTAVVGIFSTTDAAHWRDGLLMLDTFNPLLAFALTASLISYIAYTARLSLRHGRQVRRSWLVDVGELLSLTLFFTLVPSVLAIGLYLCLWHAPRHLLRLARTLSLRVTWGAMSQVATASVPMTLGAAATLLGVWWALSVAITDWMTVLAWGLAWVAALTAPHALVVHHMHDTEAI